MALKIRRGTNAERIAGGGVVFAEGELIYVTDTDALYIGDGVTPGGILLANGELGDLSTYITANSSAGDDGELELNKPLNLNNQDIIGTGNINITGNIVATGNIDIGDNSGDTVTITAQVDSNITPTQDSTFSLGSQSKRWQNVYAAGLSVDGQIDAVSISANTVADNSTVMVNVATNTFTGNLTGNVTGNVNGTLTGNVVGDVAGILTGDVVGSVFADNSTTLVDGVAGVLRGDHYGSLYGSVKSLNNGFTVLNPGTDGTNASFVGTVVGNVTGNVTGTVVGNVTGNVTGRLDGDVTGSVFADNSTLLVDGVNGRIPGSVISGTVTANLNGNVTGNVTGNIFTNLIDSDDSSEIVVVPFLRLNSDLFVDNSAEIRNSMLIGTGTFAGPNNPNVLLSSSGSVSADTIVARFITTGNIDGQELILDSNIDIRREANFADSALFRSNISLLQLSSEDSSFAVTTFTGDLDNPVDVENLANYDNHITVNRTKIDTGVPVKFASFTTVERDALTAEVGMVIFNTTDTKLQVCTVGGGTPTWVNLH